MEPQILSMLGDLKKVGRLPFYMQFKIKTYIQRLEFWCWRQIDPYVFVRFFFFLGLISQNDGRYQEPIFSVMFVGCKRE